MKNTTKIIVRALSFIMAIAMMATLFTGCPLTEKFIYKKILSNISKEFSGKNVNIEYVLLDLNKDGSNEMVVRLVNKTSTEYRLYDSTKISKNRFIGKIIENIHIDHHMVASCSEGYSFIIQYAHQNYETITGINYDGKTITSKVLLDRKVPMSEDYYDFDYLNFYPCNDLAGLSSAVALNSANVSKLRAITKA